MLDLTVYPKGFGEISGSPFAAKAICLMEMSGLAYRLDVNPDPRKSPKGKFPILNDGGQIIADSDFIRDHLEKKYGCEFDAGMDAKQRAVSRLVIRTLEENFYFAVVASRWQDDGNWPITRGEFFKGVPKLIRGFVAGQVRKGVIRQLHGQGMGRHEPSEQLARAAKDVSAVEDILGDKPFLFGDKPTAADASAVPMLRAAASFSQRTPIGDLVTGSDRLAAYIERGKAEMYPA